MADKLEFCSKAWVDEAERVLNALLAEAGDTVAGDTYSVSETFTDPPAHIGSGEVSWGFAFADGKVSVTRGPLAGADMSVRVDYQATLPVARMIYDTSPEEAAKRRAAREARRAASIAAGEPVPPPPAKTPSPALMALMTELHNSLARVTA